LPLGFGFKNFFGGIVMVGRNKEVDVVRAVLIARYTLVIDV